jgi:DNA-binding NarL/FixJ family response regulator
MNAPALLKVLIFDDTYLELQGIERVLHDALSARPHTIRAVRILPKALEHCEQWRPELIVADGEIYTDKRGGAAFVRAARRLLPQAKIMGLTRYPECYDMLHAAGCDHVINKSVLDSPDAVKEHLEATLLARRRAHPEKHPPTLKPEEDQVLRLMTRGLTEQQIAEARNLSQRQVRYFKQALYNKFGTSKDNELIALAYTSGYLSPDEDLSALP